MTTISNSNLVTVSDLKVGEKAKILDFYAGDPQYQIKLIKMGLVPGTVFSLVRMAPLGDPIEIQFETGALCLRKKEADIFKIERVIERVSE